MLGLCPRPRDIFAKKKALVDDDVGLDRVGDEAAVVGVVVECCKLPRIGRVAGPGDVGVELDARDMRLCTRCHMALGRIGVAGHFEPGLTCEVEKPEHVARGDCGDECFFRINRRRVGEGQGHIGR